jgi:type IV pilus assembly protein PilE
VRRHDAAAFLATDEMMRHASCGGFSLLELLTVMAILALLTAIALPSYADYVARSRRFEARAGLLEAAHWMERWRTERGRYDDPANPGQPPPDFPWRQIPVAGHANYSVSLVATAVSYRVTATPARTMASDACESLSIDETGLRSFTGDRGTEEICWNR